MSDETTRARLGEDTLQYLRRHADNPWVRGLLELLDERAAAHAETVTRLEQASELYRASAKAAYIQIKAAEAALAAKDAEIARLQQDAEADAIAYAAAIKRLDKVRDERNALREALRCDANSMRLAPETPKETP